MSEAYIKPGRVLIAVQMIFVPSYFLILSNSFKHVDLPFVPSFISELLARLIIPFVLSLPFIVFSYFQRYEVSEAYEHMGEQIWKLPNSIKAFYGFNFLLVLLFGLPFIAPVIACSGGYFIGLVLFGVKEGEPQIRRPLIRGSTTIFLPFAILIAIIFYAQIWSFFTTLVDVWSDNIEVIYYSALNIANGALIGGLLLLLFEYLEKADYTYERPPFVDTFFSIVVFILLELILVYFFFFTSEGLTGDQKLIFSIVNVGGFLLSLGILIIRYFFKLGEEEEGTSLIGWITIFAFQLVNLASSGELALFSRTTAVLVCCIIFLFLFISSYNEATKYV
ncbi:MAG: hypothetical protein ACXAC7_21385 [Candidatus Hodarchaeales archaeon]|jgi:hypothetical protein